MIVLDTHVALWLANDDAALGPSSLSTILAARDERQLAVSAISFWEIALLASKRRLELEQDPLNLRDELLDTGVIEIPLTGRVAILAVELDIPHSGPADRFIVATAIANEATLITVDRTLLRWHHKLPRQNAAK